MNNEIMGAVETLTRTERLLVALDFDGTLAPEVDDPLQARALPAADSAIRRLCGLSDTRVALVSGRAIDSLTEVSNVPHTVLLVGSHGIELRLDEAGIVNTLTDDERERVARLHDVLQEAVAGFDTVWIESKPAGFAVHTRQSTAEDCAAAHRAVLKETSTHFDNLTVRDGKNILEFSVRSTTKGEGIEYLRRYTQATAVFYVGDDVTDEDAFAVLGDGDMGVKSGPGETIAPHRVGGPQEVAQLVTMIAEQRKKVLANRE